MASIKRNDWSRGWVPDADDFGAPANLLLRSDNLELDEEGVLSLRRGSVAAYPSPLPELDVHSLYSAVLSGSKVRLIGAGDKVYHDQTEIANSIAGVGDTSFLDYLGRLFFARSTSKKKYDGIAAAENWGIDMTGDTPTLAGLDPNSKVIATLDDDEAPGLTAVEGAVAFVDDRDAVSLDAAELQADADSNRATAQITFTAPIDLTDISGIESPEEDAIDLWVWIKEPQVLVSVDVQFDADDGSFATDYFSFRLLELTLLPDPPDGPGDGEEGSGGIKFQSAGFKTSASKDTARDAASRFRSTLLTSPLPIAGAASEEWQRFSIKKSSFSRVVTAAGKGWDTIKAMRFTVLSSPGVEGAVRLDDVQLIGGADRPLSGEYEYAYVYVNSAPSAYNALSELSAASEPFSVKAAAVRVTAPEDLSRDAQVNEIWVYRSGGTLDAWYRVKVITGVTDTSAQVTDDELSDVDALIVNIKYEVGGLPPDDIIDLEGPYNDRIYALTNTTLWPSKIRQPERFDPLHGVLFADEGEEAFWVKWALGRLFIGTSKDIYSLQGTGVELQDLTVDYTKRALGIADPPISKAVAQGGDLIIYLSSTGWRVFNGSASVPLARDGNTALDFLYKGKDRHGVSAANLTTGRFAATVEQGRVLALVPEGTSGVSASQDMVPTSILASVGWTDATVANLSTSNDVRATDGRPGEFISAELTDVPHNFSASVSLLVNVEARTQGTVTRQKQLLLEVRDKADRILENFTTSNLTGSDANYSSSVILRVEGSAQVNGWRVRATVQEGAGTADTATVEIDRLWIGPLSYLDATTPVLHRFDTLRNAWSRRVYPYNLRSLFTEPGGTVIAGDSAGKVYELGSGSDDDGTKQPVAYRGPFDSLGEAQARKELWDLGMVLKTGDGETASVALHLNGSDAPEIVRDVAPIRRRGWADFHLAPPSLHVQLRITGDFTAFSLSELDWSYGLRPRLQYRVEDRPLDPSLNRRKFAGLTVVYDSQGKEATLATIVDGVEKAVDTLLSNEIVTERLAHRLLVGRSIWGRIEAPHGIEKFAISPVVVEEYPQQVSGLLPSIDAGRADWADGYRLRVCTLGKPVLFTPVADGELQPDIAFTLESLMDEPITEVVAIGRDLEAEQWSLFLDAEAEVFKWEPQFKRQDRPRKIPWPLDLDLKEPVGGKRDIWFMENRISSGSVNRSRFSGYSLAIDTHKFEVRATMLLEELEVGSRKIVTSDLERVRLNIDGGARVGKDFWLRLWGEHEFAPRDIQPLVVESLPVSVRGVGPRTNADHEGPKVINGMDLRICTMGKKDVVLHPVLDGRRIEGEELEVETGEFEPDTIAWAFSREYEATDIAVDVQPEAEIYPSGLVSPRVLYNLPAFRKAWDSGPVDLSVSEGVWVREIRVKAACQGDSLQFDFEFDGELFEPRALDLTDPTGGQITRDDRLVGTVHLLPVPREYHGLTPQVRVRSALPFRLWWVEFSVYTSGSKRQRTVRVKG